MSVTLSCGFSLTKTKNLTFFEALILVFSLTKTNKKLRLIGYYCIVKVTTMPSKTCFNVISLSKAISPLRLYKSLRLNPQDSVALDKTSFIDNRVHITKLIIALKLFRLQFPCCSTRMIRNGLVKTPCLNLFIL